MQIQHCLDIRLHQVSNSALFRDIISWCFSLFLTWENFPFLFSRHKSYYLSAIPFGRLRLNRPPPFYSCLRVALAFWPLVFHSLYVSRLPFSSSFSSFPSRFTSFIPDMIQSGGVTVVVESRRLKYRLCNYNTSRLTPMFRSLNTLAMQFKKPKELLGIVFLANSIQMWNTK